MAYNRRSVGEVGEVRRRPEGEAGESGRVSSRDAGRWKGAFVTRWPAASLSNDACMSDLNGGAAR